MACSHDPIASGYREIRYMKAVLRQRVITATESVEAYSGHHDALAQTIGWGRAGVWRVWGVGWPWGLPPGRPTTLHADVESDRHIKGLKLPNVPWHALGIFVTHLC